MIREVERWRGDPAVRSRRAEVRNLRQLAYFDVQLDHPDWSAKRILDFGGSDGNLLWNPGCPIPHENYYCLDVMREAIEDGRRTFPRAHWIHYDHYNCSFNPHGIRNLPIPDLGTDFDLILAYSVFTHIAVEEMRELVGQLRARLRPGGTLAFTFEEPEGNLASVLRVLRERNPAVDVDGLLRLSRGAAWCTLLHDENHAPSLFVESNGSWPDEAEHCMNYDVYYLGTFMKRQFPDGVIRPRVNGEGMHCCILKAS